MTLAADVHLRTKNCVFQMERYVYEGRTDVDNVQGEFQSLLGEVPDDFDSWVSLISQTEKLYPNDIQRICLVYDGFLSEFPLCNGHWKKYAAHKAQLCTLDEVEEVYRRSVRAIPYSVDLWVSYCSFGVMTYKDPEGVQRLFEQALSRVKKDYVCHLLWDKYIEYVYSQKQWSQVAHIILRALQFPTKKLKSYYDWFKGLVGMWAKDMGYQNEIDMQTETMDDCDLFQQIDSKAYEYENVSKLIRRLFDRNNSLAQSAAIKKYSLLGEQFYQKSYLLDRQISDFEGRITKCYFSMEMLDDCQAENWHQYLNFVETQGDFEWAVKLYERCLIPCANYSEFWIRYIEFVDAKGGRELANHALGRALAVFLKRVPDFHLYSAMFKEQIGDISGARTIFLKWDLEFASDFLENVNRLANMEKRMGNIPAAYMVYERAIEQANEKQNLQIIPNLYKNFACFVFVASGEIDAAIEVLIRGVQQLPCKSTLEGLVEFLKIHGAAADIPKLDSFFVNALDSKSNISEHLTAEDRECISRAFLEVVDLYGNLHEIRRAWNSHRKLFSHRMRPKSSNKDKTEQVRDGTFRVSSNNTCLYDSSDIPDKHKTEHPTVQVGNNILSRDACIYHQEVENQGTNIVEEPVGVHEVQEQLSLNGQLHMMGIEGENELHVINQTPEPLLNEEDNEHHVINQTPKSLSLDSTSKHLAFGEHLSGEDIRSSSLNVNSQQPKETTISETSPLEVVFLPASGIEQNENNTIHSGIDKLGTSVMESSTNQSDVQEVKNPTLQVTAAVVEAEEKPNSLLEAQSQGNLHCDSPVSSFSQNRIHVLDLEQTYNGQHASQDLSSRSDSLVEASYPQQLQVNAPIAATSHFVIDQGSSCPPQVWSGTQETQANQSQILYQMADPQTYQNASIWAAQNLQQQVYAFALSQSGSQPVSQAQTDVFQQLSNNGQYSTQSIQGFAPHYWHYYQQQLYYLQQQQLRLQQQQQEQPQLQNRHMYSVMDHQASKQQLQQSQENQHLEQPPASQVLLLQQPHQQQGQQQLNQQQQQHLSNSEQISSQQQQPIEPTTQPEQQNAQVLNTQQQQQLLYLQQQQQLYMQQQQLYLQQQVQHQLFMQQYQQQNQTQEQLFQHQQTHQQYPPQWQQQLLLLQQQQQQQQQLQMQLLQQQQQHQQFQMQQQQQRQSSASESEVLTTNSHLQVVPLQSTSSQQEKDYPQGIENIEERQINSQVSQLHNREDNREQQPVFSHSSTPQCVSPK